MEFNFRVVDGVLELLNEAYSWAKSQVEAFFKLMCNNLTTTLLSAKSLVNNCCEKFKQILAATNKLIENGVQKVFKTNPDDHQNNQILNPDDHQEEVSLLDEMKKLIQKMMPFVSYLTECVDPMCRPKGETMKVLLDLVEGFIELLQCGLNQPVKLIVIFIDGFLIYRKFVNKKLGNGWNFPKHKGKAAMAIAALLGLINIFEKISGPFEQQRAPTCPPTKET